MKKVISLLLCVCFIFSFNAPIFASDNSPKSLRVVVNYASQDADKYVVSIIDDLSYIITKRLNYLSYDLNNVYIGNAFNIFGEEVLYYPVYVNGEIILLVEVIESAEGFSINVGSFYSKTLNSLNTTYIYKVVADQDGGIYAVSDEDVILLKEPVYTNVLGEMQEFSEIPSVSLFMSKDEIIDTSESFINVQQERSTRALSAGLYLYEYPGVKQPQYSKCCWAACMTSIVRKFGYSDTLQNVLDKTKQTEAYGAHVIQVQGWLKSLYNINSTATNMNAPLTFAQSITEISAGRAYIQVIDVQGGGLHDVLIMGYNALADTNWICYMDPADGQYHDQTVASTGIWIKSYGYISENQGALCQISK